MKSILLFEFSRLSKSGPSMSFPPSLMLSPLVMIFQHGFWRSRKTPSSSQSWVLQTWWPLSRILQTWLTLPILQNPTSVSPPQGDLPWPPHLKELLPIHLPTYISLCSNLVSSFVSMTAGILSTSLTIISTEQYLTYTKHLILLKEYM